MTGKVLGIISIKGGVGKTTVTVALGFALANEFGKKVLLVDTNFSAPNLALHVGFVNPKRTIHNVLCDNMPAEKAVYASEYGFDILPGALVYGKINPSELRNKIMPLREKYDVILIDSSPTLNEEIVSAILASDEILVVTTPDHITLANTLLAIKLAKKSNVNVLGLVLNKVHRKSFELDIDEIEEISNSSVLAVVPYELKILEALSRNVPSTKHAMTDSTVEYKKLAGALIGKRYNDPRLKSRIKQMFSRKAPKQEINRNALQKRA